MTPGDDKPNFLDRGTLIAIVITMVFWFGWTKFMEAKYPQPVASAVPAAAQATGGQAGAGQTAGMAVTPGTVAAKAGTPSEILPKQKEEITTFTSDNLAFEISSQGMGLRNIDIKKYRTRDDAPIILGKVQSDYPFATQLIGLDQPLNFVVQQTEADTFVGRATWDGLQIEKTLHVDTINYALDTTISVTGEMDRFKGVATYLSEPVQTPAKSGLLGSSSREFQDWFIRHDGKKTRQAIPLKTPIAEGDISVAALSNHYFTLAIADKSDLMPRFDAAVGTVSTPPGGTDPSGFVVGRLLYQPVSRVDQFKVHFVGYAGPKSFEGLSHVDEGLAQVVDFGIFGFLAKPILWLLKFLFSIVGNWGVAVVLLTIIVRTIVLPFNAYSFKSMKAMQRIQPEMTRVRERYKNKSSEDKLQMNKEIMDLMKTNKASPLGGCLPTLLQLPPFFALYQVLGQSIELYRAPFIFWIHDLSARDPYFVLPVLMGATMFLQQKLTPTTMDPQQAKMMQWMPLVFSIFMVSLPSGLTLYIFVSTLFGITQQYFFMRDKSRVPSRVNEAKA